MEGFAVKLTPEQKTEILARAAKLEKFEDIAAAMNVPRVTVSKLCMGALWRGEIEVPRP